MQAIPKRQIPIPNGKGAWRRTGVSGPPEHRRPKQAATITLEQVEHALNYIEATSNAPRSDELKLTLSYFAGLRAAEISGLQVKDMLESTDKIARDIFVSSAIAKGGRDRTIPMHPRVAHALERFRSAHPDVPFVAFSARHNIKHQSPNSVTTWFSRLYADLQFVGCSSHSGRRSFITRMARSAGQFNTCLLDVQRFAGHAQLNTTQLYIEPNYEQWANIIQAV